MGKNKGECNKSLDSIPYGEMPKWGQTARFLINTKQKLGLGNPKNVKGRRVPTNGAWQKYLANELHKPAKRNFTRRGVIVNESDDVWAADLVEMQQFSKWNKGYRYLLMVIDVFSKYGWIVPLKNKQGKGVASSLQSIFSESGRVPKMVWTDKGSEFYNTHVKDLLGKHNVRMYSTENEEKS